MRAKGERRKQLIVERYRELEGRFMVDPVSEVNWQRYLIYEKIAFHPKRTYYKARYSKCKNTS